MATFWALFSVFASVACIIGAYHLGIERGKDL